jgi:hypothetical protein
MCNDQISSHRAEDTDPESQVPLREIEFQFPGNQHDNALYPALRTDELVEVKFPIPGTGAITVPGKCGEWISIAACSMDPSHYKQPIKHSCDCGSCPSCWPRWGKKASKRISSRFRGYRDTVQGQSLFDGVEDRIWHKHNAKYLRHIVLSPPSGIITPDMDITKIKKQGRKFASSIGITGGVLIPHLYRVKREVWDTLMNGVLSSTERTEQKRKVVVWDMIRTDALHLGSWDLYCYWAPHFHIIGFGRIPNQRNPIYLKRKGNWVVKVVETIRWDRKYTGQDIEDPVEAIAFYLLSHTSIVKGRNALSWFGICSPYNLRKEGSPVCESYPVVCPVCGSTVVIYDGSVQPWGKRHDKDGHEIPYRIRDYRQHYVFTKNGHTFVTKWRDKSAGIMA